jgi:hypothetical protein
MSTSVGRKKLHVNVVAVLDLSLTDSSHRCMVRTFTLRLRPKIIVDLPSILQYVIFIKRREQMKHTLNPWLIGRGADGYPIIHTPPCNFSPSGQGIAHICKRPISQEHIANARLIAAAPDMLAALRFFRGGYGDPNTWPDADVQALRVADAAIAKATKEP